MAITAANLAGAVVGLGEANGVVWGMTSRGRLLRLGTNGFAEVLALTDGSNAIQPRDFEVSASGRMFVLTTVRFGTCASSCEQQANWSFQSIPAGNEVLEALCVVADDHVLAIGNRGASNDGIGYRWTGAQLASSALTLGATNVKGCWRGLGNDGFFIGARDAVVRYEPAASSFTPEATMGTSWLGGGTAMGSVFASGSGPVIARRTAGPVWANELSLSTAGVVRVILGVAADRAFAFGGGPSSSGQAAYQYERGAWSALLPDVPVLNVAYSGLVTSDGRLFVGGDDANSNACIVRGQLE
jgi:hypothetical protein